MKVYIGEKILIDTTLSNIASLIGGEMVGCNIHIDGLNLLNRSILANNVLSYCTALPYIRTALENNKVKALILTKKLYEEFPDAHKSNFSYIISESPEWTFYAIFMLLIDRGFYPIYEWETALKDVEIGPGTIIENGVLIGQNVKIGYNSIIKTGTVIDNNVIIGSNTIVGGNGFQLIKDNNGVNQLIPHVGRVYIGENVSIGDCVNISKSLFEGFTSIGNHSKIANFTSIEHNCTIGNNCVLCARATMFGSSELRNNVYLAPNSSIMNRVIVEEGSFIGASALVRNNVEPHNIMIGIPARKLEKKE